VVIIYVPSNVPIYLKGQFVSLDDYAIDLEQGKKVSLTKILHEEKTEIQMTPFLKDSLYVIHK
ncbi:beta-glucosidase, partial [Listeria monocytogenes]|nr:beta-glucosidase [Listeria monocytogenes]